MLFIEQPDRPPFDKALAFARRRCAGAAAQGDAGWQPDASGTRGEQDVRLCTVATLQTGLGCVVTAELTGAGSFGTLPTAALPE